MKKQFILLGLGSALVLSGCGGGGGSSGTTTGAGAGAPVATPVSTLSSVTTANATQVAASAYASSVALSDSSAPVNGLLTGVSIDGARAGAVAPVLSLVRKVYPRTTPLLTGVVMTEACTGGGTMTVDANLRNQQTISNGDTLKITANNCVEDGVVINGSMSIAMSNITGDIVNSYNWSATLDTTFSNFTARSGNETAGIGGDMKIAMAQTSMSNSTINVSGKSLQLVEQRNGLTLGTYTLSNYTMNETVNGAAVSSAASFSIAGNSSGLGQFSYTVKNLQPFVSIGMGNPSSGSLIVNGASSSVTLTSASTSSVRLEYSAKGDGVITQISNLSWAELLAAL
ncbi:hypothetical protein [Massilia suwonensis]|uniref:Lipoprotein n=1 Tax=Massilia suwonensis TaxID=648895 RepID=A0ABW0MKG2_9BURK